MSAVSTSRPRPKDYLSKRIPVNPKYQNVRSKTDTGASMSKYMNKIEEIRKNYKFRPNEIFKRMKVTTFVQLAVQVYHINTEGGFDQIIPPSTAGEFDDVPLPEAGDGNSPVPSLALTAGDYGYQNNDDLGSARSTLLSERPLRTPYAVDSVAHGVGELDLNAPAVPPRNDFVNDVCPYLLLDVRDRDEYDQCHIITAHNYPKANLSRATNFETKEMLQYRNVPGKIIILCDEDERIAPHAATTLVQRGYDNLFMLSGGIRLAHKLVPEGLLTGTPPPSITGVKCKDPYPALQKNFTPTDIDRIEIYLDSALQDKSIGSRLSQASTARSRNAMSTARTSAGSTASQPSTLPERPPFK